MTEMSLSEYNARSQTGGKKQPPVSRVGVLIVALVLVAGISFFGGVQYQKGKTPATTSAQSAASTNGQSGGGAAGGFGHGSYQRGDRAIGTVTAVSGTSITVQSRSGSSNTYTITSSTTVTDNGQSSSVSDIQTGDTVFMTLDSSNTQDVTSIMLNPTIRLTLTQRILA
jgi:hypothetical protein